MSVNRPKPFPPPDPIQEMANGHRYLKIHIVEVYVRDQNASLAFYRDRLGFEVVVDTGPQEWGRWVAVAPPVYETAVLGLRVRATGLPMSAGAARTSAPVPRGQAAKCEVAHCVGLRAGMRRQCPVGARR